MFSSLASFIFGSNTSASTNSEVNQNPTTQEEELKEEPVNIRVRIDDGSTVPLTSLTPSVTGGSNVNNVIVHQQGGKRGKNKRNKNKQQKSTSASSKLLTPTDNFNEDEWCFVEKEGENVFVTHTDSEEELSIVEVKQKQPRAPLTNINAAGQQRRHQQNINSHTRYSGPRPQQQRNSSQRVRNNTIRLLGSTLPPSTLNPPRRIAGSAIPADNGATHAVYAVPCFDDGYSGNDCGNKNGAKISMEESWFVTPPPCFTSIGPINMETSPFENLLIEHPSMSVYHSIRSAQVATDSFVNLDLGVNESQKQERESVPEDGVIYAAENGATAEAVAEPAPMTAVAVAAVAVQQAPSAATAVAVAEPSTTPRVASATTVQQQQRPAPTRADRYSDAQLKQELLERHYQKSLEKKERQNLCRGAIKRANKVREYQSKGRRQRRADMQHCKIISGANNNRKCCY